MFLLASKTLYIRVCFSPIWLLVTLWSIACQASPSMGFSRQEYWSGLPCSTPRALPDPGIKPASHELQADSLPREQMGSPFKYYYNSNLSSDQEVIGWKQILRDNLFIFAFSPVCSQIIPGGLKKLLYFEYLWRTVSQSFLPISSLLGNYYCNAGCYNF